MTVWCIGPRTQPRFDGRYGPYSMHYTVSVRRVATGSCAWPRCVVYRQYIASTLYVPFHEFMKWQWLKVPTQNGTLASGHKD